MKPTELSHKELWPDKLPNSFLNRARETIEFIDLPLKGPIADCGESNPLRNMIMDKYGFYIFGLLGDFDKQVAWDIPVNFETIFIFEVIEHLYNPLLFLREVRRILGRNGVIYLSTPYQRPQFLKAVHHYHEIPTDRLMWLFDEAELKIVKEGRATIAGDWYNHLGGIRPVLRYFQKTRLYKLQRKEKGS